MSRSEKFELISVKEELTNAQAELHSLSDDAR